MLINEELYEKLTMPLRNKLDEGNVFNAIDDPTWCWKWMGDSITHKYRYINQLVDYILSIKLDKFNYDHQIKVFDTYVNTMMELPMKSTGKPIIDKQIIHFAIIRSVVDQRNEDAGGVTAAESLIRCISEDNLIDNNEILDIAFEYIQYMNSYYIIRYLLPRCKLTQEHLDTFCKHYKYADIHTVSDFADWGLRPSRQQICQLIANKNRFMDEEFINEFNVEINSDYIIANLKAGNHKIIGVNPKHTWTFDEKQKKELSTCLFENDYTKKEIISMKERYGLTFDINSMLTLCKNEGSISVFNYLADLGIKPTLECIRHLIPKHCFHQRVHDILSRCAD